MKSFLSLLLLMGISSLIFSQTYIHLSVTQAPPLLAHAGDDASYIPGSPVTIGGSPSAEGGTGEYFYLWSPSTGLSSPTVSNPAATITQNTAYMLLVTDSKGCTASDLINVNETNSIPEYGSDNVLIYPNPTRQLIHVEIKNNFKPSWYAIYDNKGKQVMKMQITPGINAIDADISRLSKGAYIIRIGNNQSQIERTFICN